MELLYSICLDCYEFSNNNLTQSITRDNFTFFFLNIAKQ